MNHREMTNGPFEGALHQQDPQPAIPSPAVSPYPAYPLPPEQPSPQQYAEAQAYAAEQQARAQQQAYYAQQQAYLQHQAYLAQQQAYAQQAAYPARQQFAQPQAPAPQHPHFAPGFQQTPTAEPDPGDLISAASVVPPAFSHPDQSPANESSAPLPAVAPAFVFRKPGEPIEDATNAAMRSSSDEFAAIMDAKMAKDRKKRGNAFAITLLLFFGPTLGGAGWFVSDPDRMYALHSAISEIRSAGDIQSLIARYQKSLEKVAVRGQHIDEATAMMGIDPKVAGSEDPFFGKEMQEMAGPDGGPSVAQRNQKLKENFGDFANGKLGKQLKEAAGQGK